MDRFTSCIPRGVHALVRPIPEEEMNSSQLMANTASGRASTNFAEVIAVGPGLPDLSAGDFVLLRQYVGCDIKFNGLGLLVVREEEIAAIVAENPDWHDIAGVDLAQQSPETLLLDS